MGRFVSAEVVPVHTEDDTENVIYIKPKMDYATKTRVRSTIIKATTNPNGGTKAVVDLDLAAGNLALLVNNIVSWRGPDFDSMPCNAENIGRLDDDDPLVDKVLAEINRRNPEKETSPNASSASGKSDLMPTTAQKKQGASTQPSVQ